MNAPSKAFLPGSKSIWYSLPTLVTTLPNPNFGIPFKKLAFVIEGNTSLFDKKINPVLERVFQKEALEASLIMFSCSSDDGALPLCSATYLLYSLSYV